MAIQPKSAAEGVGVRAVCATEAHTAQAIAPEHNHWLLLKEERRISRRQR